MASKSLNQTMRRHLRNKLLAKRFSAEEEELQKREAELAEQAWKKLIGQKNIEKIQSIPDGWLSDVGIVRVDAGGGARFTGLSPSKRLPVPDKFRGNAVQASPDSKLGAAVRKLIDDKAALHNNKRKIGAQIDAALGQFNTTKQLREGWPEVAEFLPTDSDNKRVPMVPVKRLNKALGLSKEPNKD